jgi:hypothetical protein
LALAADSATAVIDDSRSHIVTFIDAAAQRREATFPVVIFSRERTPRLRSTEGAD